MCSGLSICDGYTFHETSRKQKLLLMVYIIYQYVFNPLKSNGYYMYH
jgi:hypothetical protein